MVVVVFERLARSESRGAWAAASIGQCVGKILWVKSGEWRGRCGRWRVKNNVTEEWDRAGRCVGVEVQPAISVAVLILQVAGVEVGLVFGGVRVEVPAGL